MTTYRIVAASRLTDGQPTVCLLSLVVVAATRSVDVLAMRARCDKNRCGTLAQVDESKNKLPSSCMFTADPPISSEQMEL